MIPTDHLADMAALTQLLFVFGWGLITSLTPCVYPLIPITLSLFGAASEKSISRAFMLSFCYVLGIAATYTCLGMISALTGVLFGSALSNPWVVLVLILFLVSLGLFSLELLRFNFIYQFQTKACQVGGKGALGSFLMGSVSGVVAGPCVGPVLVLILAIAANSKNVVWGGCLLFTYSFGMGLPFLILGTFSGLISKLPKSGSWLNAIKFITASALFVVALRLAWPYLGSISRIEFNIQPAQVLSVCALALLISYFSYRHEMKLLRLAAALIIALVFAPSSHLIDQSSDLVWNNDMQQALAQGAKEKRFSMVDLYADWCAACKELDAKTFHDPKVEAELKKLTLARVDFTAPSEIQNSIAQKYKVVGLPCVMLFSPKGEEVSDFRVTGFLEPELFLKKLHEVISKADS